jgi:hypothetical protein
MELWVLVFVTKVRIREMVALFDVDIELTEVGLADVGIENLADVVMSGEIDPNAGDMCELPDLLAWEVLIDSVTAAVPVEVYVWVALGSEMLPDPTRDAEREGCDQEERDIIVVAVEAMVDVTVMLRSDSSGAVGIPTDWMDDAVLRVQLVVEDMMIWVREAEIGELNKDVSTVLGDDPFVPALGRTLVSRDVVLRATEDDTVRFSVAEWAPSPVARIDIVVIDAVELVLPVTVATILSVGIVIRDSVESSKVTDAEMVRLPPKAKVELSISKLLDWTDSVAIAVFVSFFASLVGMDPRDDPEIVE